jgi:hypothetical protein
MNNSIIGKVSKSKYFNYRPLPLPGEYMPIPSSLPNYQQPRWVSLVRMMPLPNDAGVKQELENVRKERGY